jgi:carboxyl-terminal processing protease
MPQRNLLIVLVAVAVSLTCYVSGQQNPHARYLGRGLAEIEHSGLERIDNQELYDRAMNAMIDVLHKHGDEHSQFIPREDADPFRAELRQQFGGIGVRIRYVGDPPKLVLIGAPEPGTPAAVANLRSGDRLLAIDDKPTDGMKISDVLHAMRGAPGEPIRLSIQHVGADRPETVNLVREVITVKSIVGDRRSASGGWEYRLESDPRIALVRVTSFGSKTTEEINRVLAELTKDGVEAVVLDLRDDSGGALDAAVAVCDMFLPAGAPIVETQGRDGQVIDRYVASGHGAYQKLPLAVLVNQHSASASEIVAACLQDNHRAVVLGQRSYGKGTVQKLIPTESGHSLLKLTAASYHRPNGKNIHRAPGATDAEEWGVSPDAGYDLPLTEEQFEAYRKYRDGRDLWGALPEELATDDEPFVDRPLEKAVEYLQGVLGK